MGEGGSHLMSRDEYFCCSFDDLFAVPAFSADPFSCYHDGPAL